MCHDKFSFSLHIILFPNLAELFLNGIFNWFKIEAVCKKIEKNTKPFDDRFIGQISILTADLVKIFTKYDINLQNCDAFTSSEKMIIIDRIRKIVYRCSANELDSIGIINNYNYLASSKFANVPKPIFMQKNDDLTISAETLMSGTQINVKDVNSEILDEIIRQITPLYNINRTIHQFNFNNELNKYDSYLEHYCPVWANKLEKIKQLIISSIDLPLMNETYVCKTLIHGDLTYRNVLSDDSVFLYYDFDRSEISYPEFDIYLLYIDWLTHANKAKYEVLFSNIFKFIHDEIHIPSIGVLDYTNSAFRMNLNVAQYLKYIYLYRMLVLSLQNFNVNNTYPIKILNMVIRELEV